MKNEVPSKASQLTVKPKDTVSDSSDSDTDPECPKGADKFGVISFLDEPVLFTSWNINRDRLKLQFSDIDITDKDELLTTLQRGNGCPLSYHVVVENASSDGNCFFESIPLGLFLDRSHHKMLRTAIAEYDADSDFFRESHGSKSNAGRSEWHEWLICGPFLLYCSFQYLEGVLGHP